MKSAFVYMLSPDEIDIEADKLVAKIGISAVAVSLGMSPDGAAKINNLIKSTYVIASNYTQMEVISRVTKGLDEKIKKATDAAH